MAGSYNGVAVPSHGNKIGYREGSTKFPITRSSPLSKATVPGATSGRLPCEYSTPPSRKRTEASAP